jgi:hypothetical protein
MTSSSAATRDASLSNNEELDWSRKIRRARRALDESNGVYRALLKGAKKAGMNTTKLIEAHGAARKESESVITDVRDFIHYSQLIGIPGLSPDSIFAKDVRITDTTQIAEDLMEAEDRGYRDGKNGTPLGDNPFVAGTELHVVYTHHWHEGQAALGAEMGPRGEVAQKSRAHPGRKAAAGGTTPPAPAKMAAPKKAAAGSTKRGPARKAATATNGGNVTNLH